LDFLNKNITYSDITTTKIILVGFERFRFCFLEKKD